MTFSADRLMNTSMRLWQHPDGCWHAEPGRNRRRSLGTRDQAEAQKLYRRLKAEFLLNQFSFLDGSRRGPKTLEGIIGADSEWICQKSTYNTYSQGHSGVRAHLAQARTKLANAFNLRPIPQER